MERRLALLLAVSTFKPGLYKHLFSAVLQKSLSTKSLAGSGLPQQLTTIYVNKKPKGTFPTRSRNTVIYSIVMMSSFEDSGTYMCTEIEFYLDRKEKASSDIMVTKMRTCTRKFIKKL